MSIAVLQYAWTLTSTGDASMNIYPYVYRLDHPITGEFYIGYRSANKVPASEDLGIRYFTSSKTVKPRFHEFRFCIIAEFFDADVRAAHRQLAAFRAGACRVQPDL